MSEFFMGQVMMTGFGFAPKYFAACNGQLLPIQQNQALFSLLGTQYGGNGVSTFALPDLRGRTPLGYANSVDAGWQPPSIPIGQAAGTETVALQAQNLPAHGHAVNATTSAGTARIPRGNLVGSTAVPLFGSAANNPVLLNAQTVAASGNNVPHANMQPYTVINFCIALSGIFPSRN